MRNRQTGVTLIELITVVVIVGILSAIAIPSYRNYTIRANRTDAKTALMFYAGALERCYTRVNSYLEAAGCTVTFPKASENGHYQITASEREATLFKLVATPQGGQAADTGCGNLELDAAGVRDNTGIKTVAECWGK